MTENGVQMADVAAKGAKDKTVLSGDIAIKVDELSFRYRETKKYAVAKASFEVKKGEFFCIVGPNGSGKSTICNAIVGLIPHYFVGNHHGDVFVEGIDVNNSTIGEVSEKVGFVFQNPFNQLSYTAGTVAEELAYGLANRGVPREEMIERVNEIAKTVRIDHIIDKNPLELSGGQVQRLAVGSSLIMRPDILVLDECTTQLDPLGSEEIFDIVKKLNDEGKTIVMVDHDMERVARCADRVMVISDAHIKKIGTPQEVFNDPEIESWGIEPPDYVKVAQVLRDEGVTVDRVPVTEQPTIDLVKEALAK